MVRTWLLVAGLTLGALAQGAAAAAQDEPRLALVVGNSTYRVAPLRNPANDAEDVARVLRELDFKVTLLKDASQRQMKDALREFGTQLRKGGVGLFYFAGHGVQSRGRNYLVPVGASIESEAEMEFEAIDANLVLSYMAEADNRVNIVILDACRNNPFARSFRSASRGLAQMEAARGSFIGFATAPGAEAADGNGRNGVYTEALLSSLAQPDTDIDKVFRRVTADVSRTTSGKQVPWVSHSLTGDFRFRSLAAAAPIPVVGSTGGFALTDTTSVERLQMAMELMFWDSIKASQDPEDYEAYMKRYPEGQFSDLARNRIRQLKRK